MDQPSTLLPPDWSIPSKLRDRLGTSAGRQRLLAADGHFLIVLHAAPGADEIGRRGRFFWRDPNGAWHTAPTADRVASLADHVEEYRLAIEELERADEAAGEARDFFELLDRITPLVRATRHLHDVLQQARESVSDDRDLIVVRDQASDLLRRVEILHDDSRNGLDYAIARQGEQLAEMSYQMSVATHRLNVLAAFFFPFVVLSAVFGLNLHHGLESWDESNRPWPLLIVIGSAALCGMILTAFVTRPARRPPRHARNSAANPAAKRST
jgi:CorA-like Mg2+ transporter protein